MAMQRYFNPFYQIDFIWKMTNGPAKAKRVSQYREELFEKVIHFRKVTQLGLWSGLHSFISCTLTKSQSESDINNTINEK